MPVLLHRSYQHNAIGVFNRLNILCQVHLLNVQGVNTSPGRL